jgi:3-methyl-2-oxobutanoate hydroxymethyltransferase
VENKVTIAALRGSKGARKITMLTAYDYPMAAALDQAGIDIALVGDSVANVVLGLESTKQVGMAEMLYHARAVRRAVQRAFLVGDMPFEAYQNDVTQAVANARRFVDEAGCDAVKLEWFDQAVEASRLIVEAGIPVMGHIGLTPQTADRLGGFKVQGKDAEAASRLIRQAIELQGAGCFSVLMECVPDRVAELITDKLEVPTIGIGAGPHCDGQVLVTHDLLGLFDRYTPKFVKKYAHLSEEMVRAFKAFADEVREGRFPDNEHSFHIDPKEFEKLEGSSGSDS